MLTKTFLGLSKYLDFINLMTYDYNEDDKTSHNAPLSGDPNGENIQSTVDYFLKVNKSKFTLKRVLIELVFLERS